VALGGTTGICLTIPASNSRRSLGDIVTSVGPRVEPDPDPDGNGVASPGPAMSKGYVCDSDVVRDVGDEIDAVLLSLLSVLGDRGGSGDRPLASCILLSRSCFLMSEVPGFPVVLGLC
jgi:hypothetical protein